MVLPIASAVVACLSWGQTGKSRSPCHFCGAVLQGGDDYSWDVDDGGSSSAIYPASDGPDRRRGLCGGSHVNVGSAAQRRWRNHFPPCDTPVAGHSHPCPQSYGHGHCPRRRRRLVVAGARVRIRMGTAAIAIQEQPW